MPYIFECTRCGHKFESVSAPFKIVHCRSCGDLQTDKIVTRIEPPEVKWSFVFCDPSTLDSKDEQT